MTVAEFLAFAVVFIAMPLNWTTTVLLLRLVRQKPGYRVLRERALVSVSVSLLVTVFALIFVNNDLLPPPLDIDATRIVTRLTILALSTLPALYWLRLYYLR